MEDNQLNEAYLVVVPVLDDKNILVGSGIQVIDDVLVDLDAEENFVAAPDAEEKFVAAPGKSHVILFLYSDIMQYMMLIAAVEQAARIDAAEQAINTS
ncbi:hypothetical protein Tco_0503400 [Tanacetum coccineum]